ncbi:MAG TPA: PIG-L family deacetylase [Pyrinomonadaceae bacterium]|nr:PIG-L family deacetylase [Pyrinomonadaceae bacterium]
MKSRIQESGVRSQNGLRLTQRERRAWPSFVIFMLLAIAVLSCERPINAAPLKVGEDDAAEVYQSLLDLQSAWTVMCVAAHPDDEDGATLTVLRRKYGAHTVTVFSTYGEGGQNAVGPELYEELGAIRARETIAAARIQGSEAYFLGLRDFGFSKSSAEAFRFWGHEEALRRMVLKIRELRPDVIITNHDTTSGHGHHQATGILVLEAFDAAADPRRFPEQLRNGVTVWQPQRLFVRFQFEGSGSKAAEEEAVARGQMVSVDRNERDSVRNTTYAEQALSALQRHATQGPWPQTLPASIPLIRYRLARSAKTAPPLPSNPQTFLDGMSLPGNLADELTPLAARALLPFYSANAQRGILAPLVALRKSGLFVAPKTESDAPRFRLMTERLNHALALSSGISATLTPLGSVLIPGTTTRVALSISNEGASAASIQGIRLRGLQPSNRLRFPQTLAPGANLKIELRSRTPSTAPISVPHAEHLYDGKLFGEELAAEINVRMEGAAFPVEATTRVDVAPAVEIVNITPSPLVLIPITVNHLSSSPTTPRMNPESSATFALRLVNHQNQPFRGEIIGGESASGVRAKGTAVALAPNETREILVTRHGNFSIMDGGHKGSKPIHKVSIFSVTADGRPGIITQRKVRIVWADARTAPNLRVGYIRSFDDTLRDSLAALGVEAKELSVDDVAAGDLSGYQAIIIDNRGYQAHPELIRANSRLLDYVKAGGTLIVFYHRTNEWNPDTKASRPQLAPYPITLGGSRVTDETAAIEFAEPKHPLLNYPNKITQEDFIGWIQERGLYYPQTWDAHYSAPLSTSDPKEAALRGGVLAAEYGRGHYIYTSMVWYRQLRAGIPGAYRVLANMISYGR